MVVGNKKRLKQLFEKAEAEKERQNKSSQRIEKPQKIEDLSNIPLTERWKKQSYQSFKMPLNEFIERERLKKEVKTFVVPQEVTNYIESCIKEKDLKTSIPLSARYDPP